MSPLTVAVTGPTGDIGRSLLRALDAEPEVERVLGMARRPFDPAAAGLTKTEYRQGDVLDRDALDALVADADVVVHLAFIILGKAADTHDINVRGSRNVFEAAVAGGASRLIYASSVAAYGFHEDNPQPLTEDVPPRGTEAFDYSAQKGELEGVLREVSAGRDVDAYVFRPCIVAGEDAQLLLDNLPYLKAAAALPEPARRALDAASLLKPVVPDPGVPFQLVHHDDVAAAMVAAILGRGQPGTYNLAGPGTLTLTELARELGWLAVPVPRLAVDAVAELSARIPGLPAEVQWLQAFRIPVLMDTTKAERQLGWKPRHPARETLRLMVAAKRRTES